MSAPCGTPGCPGTLSLVSLFDGIGGFPLAFSAAGARTVATVEIDKAAARRIVAVDGS